MNDLDQFLLTDHQKKIIDNIRRKSTPIKLNTPVLKKNISDGYLKSKNFYRNSTLAHSYSSYSSFYF